MPKIYITKCVIHSAIGWSFVGLACYMVWFLLLIDNLANDSSKMIDKEQRLLWTSARIIVQKRVGRELAKKQDRYVCCIR
jgi:hypothetical protein